MSGRWALWSRPKARFDEMVVMDGGVIVDRGKTSEVMKRCKLFS
jgi:ABC-type multidrug transport system fused ATPase/permease subunit